MYRCVCVCVCDSVCVCVSVCVSVCIRRTHTHTHTHITIVFLQIHIRAILNRSNLTICTPPATPLDPTYLRRLPNTGVLLELLVYEALLRLYLGSIKALLRLYTCESAVLNHFAI